MEAKRLSSSDLPDELVTKIISMMPFPSILKARTLSKVWLARFSPIQSLDDEEQKQHRAAGSQARKSLVTAFQRQVCAAAFQKQVLERSAKWPIFFLFNFGMSDSWAYELASHTWRSFPLLSLLPESVKQDCDRITTSGALLLLCTHSPSKPDKFYMANIFTRNSKLLPPCPHPRGSYSYLHHVQIVTNPSMQTYKVIMLFQLFRHAGLGLRCDCYLETYDSKSNAWSSKKFGLTPYIFRSVVYLNGVLYWTEEMKLFVLDCEEGALTELPLSGGGNGIIELVVCNFSLVMVLTEYTDFVYTRNVMKIDPGSGRLWEISCCPLALESISSRRFRSPTPVGHGDCIYIGPLESSGAVLNYNLPKDEWSYLDISPNLSISNDFENCVLERCVFEPGLNPFMPI